MAKKKVIEAEGQELVLQNQNGDTIIIPKNRREEALEMIKSNNHAGIDELASRLPYMEDYAEDGTLIPDGKSLEGKDKTKAENGITIPKEESKTPKSTVPKRALFTQNEYKSLYDEYYTSDKYRKYSATEPGSGCVGSSCKNQAVLHPEIPSFYDDYASVGLFGKEYPTVDTDKTGSLKPQGSSIGVDAWEAADFIVHNKLGDYIVSADDPKGLDKLMTMDYKDIPIGSMLTFGDARGKYVNPKAKSWRGEEGTHLTKHGGVSLGFVEDTDAEGNKVYNLLVDDLGLKTIGSGTNADMAWKTYVSDRDMKGIVKRNSAKDLNYWNLTGKKKPAKIKEKVKSTQDVLRDIKQLRTELQTSAKSELDAGLIDEKEYSKKVKESKKISEEDIQAYAKSIGLRK